MPLLSLLLQIASDNIEPEKLHTDLVRIRFL